MSLSKYPKLHDAYRQLDAILQVTPLAVLCAKYISCSPLEVVGIVLVLGK